VREFELRGDRVEHGVVAVAFGEMVESEVHEVEG
jgi:hypothetical protein